MSEELEKLSAKALATLGDQWWAARTERLAADKVAAALKVKENALNATIIEQMRAQEITAIGGGVVALTLKKTDEPVLEDKQAFWAYAKAEDDMSLFEQRISKSAVKDRWLAGKQVPGVTTFPVYKLSKTGVKE